MLALELLLKWDLGHSNLDPFFPLICAIFGLFHTGLAAGLFVCSYPVKRQNEKQTKTENQNQLLKSWM